jgi:hypothetical protein
LTWIQLCPPVRALSIGPIRPLPAGMPMHACHSQPLLLFQRSFMGHHWLMMPDAVPAVGFWLSFWAVGCIAWLHQRSSPISLFMLTKHHLLPTVPRLRWLISIMAGCQWQWEYRVDCFKHCPRINSGLSCNDRARAGCSALSNACNPNPKMLCHDAVTWNHSRSCGQQCKLKLLTYIEA